MKGIFIKSILFLSVIALNGCNYYTYYPQSDSTVQKITTSSEIKVYLDEIIDQEYDVVGSVAVDIPGDGEDAIKFLKKKVASTGANAVMNVKLTKINTFTNRTGISGVAVKLK